MNPAPKIACLNCGYAWDLGINDDGLCHVCVKEIRFNMAMEKLKTRTGRYVVALDSRGNIDFGQHPDHPMPGVPTLRVRVATLRDASDACRLYIEHYELGGGNWTGGQVFQASKSLKFAATAGKVQVAQISYNGRAWKPGPYPQPEISLEQP